MPVKLNSSGGGSVTLDVPNTASNVALTVPAAPGSVMVSGNMPAFEAYIGSNQTTNTGTNTLLQYNTKVFDTANCYNTSTYAFTPNVAGYYQVNAYCVWGSTSSTAQIFLWKNGSQFKYGKESYPATGYPDSSLSTIIYMNGTTDYIQMYCQVGANQTTQNSQVLYFNACLLRAA